VKTVEAILVGVLVLSMLVFFVCGILAFAFRGPPAFPAAISVGTGLLAFGFLCLGMAVGKTGPHARVARSDVKVGRLSSFAFGVACCAFGTLFLGYGWLREHYGLWVAVVWLASLALALLGQWIDTRAYERKTRQNGQAMAPRETAAR
jgi:hypothetical protein